MVKQGLFFCMLIMFQVSHVGANPVTLMPIKVDITDKTRLQRGAKLFMNYCSGCHSLKYMRYNRLAYDLGLTTFDGQIDNDLLKDNLIFSKATLYDPIHIAMPAVDAKQWFGMVPPDLSLTAREKGASWIYTYLSSFYVDKKRPFGTNNLLVPDVAMPNILEPLIGVVILKHKQGNEMPYLQLVHPGEMFPNQFDDSLIDLVTFLTYVSEPAQLVRYRMGFFVIIFLLVLLVLAINLKKAYWQRLKKTD